MGTGRRIEGEERCYKQDRPRRSAGSLGGVVVGARKHTCGDVVLGPPGPQFLKLARRDNWADCASRAHRGFFSRTATIPSLAS
jgi:hypothetical protein